MPKRDGDGDLIKLEDIRDLMSDTTGMSEDVEKCVKELRQRVFLYHPSDDGNPTWSKRDQIVESIQELEVITNPSHIFRTVLNVEDEKSLRDIVTSLANRVAESMDGRRYDDAALALKQIDRLTCIDNIVVERLLGGVKRRVNGIIINLDRLGIRYTMQSAFEQAEEMADQLAAVGLALSSDDPTLHNATAQSEDLREYVRTSREEKRRVDALETQVQSIGNEKDDLKRQLEVMKDIQNSTRHDMQRMREEQEKLVQASNEQQEALKTQYEEEQSRLQQNLEMASKEKRQELEKQMQQDRKSVV